MVTLGYADIEAGRRYGSTARTLTETDHGLFMMLVGDWHPIHADEDYARGTALGRRLMHASLGFSVLMGLQAAAIAFADPMVGVLGVTDWRFAAPMFIGDTVHAEVEMLGKRITSDGRRYVVERRLSLVKADGTVLQGGRAPVMLRLPDGPPRAPGAGPG